MAERRRRRSRPRPQAAPVPSSLSPVTEFERWQLRATHARRLREEWERRYCVDECERYILGEQDTLIAVQNNSDLSTAYLESLNNDRRRSVFNLTWATIQSQLPALYYQAPTFSASSNGRVVSPQQEFALRMESALLDRIAAQDDGLKTAGDLAILQAFCRIGVLKAVYEPRLENNPQAGQFIWQSNADGSRFIHPETGMGIPEVDPESGDPLREPARVIIDEVYRWDWVDAARMLLPDQGPDPRRWTWIGEEVLVPLEVAQDDERFPESLRSQFVANVRADAARGRRRTEDSWEDSPGGNPEEMFAYYECWDIYRKRWYCWADGQPYGERFLLDEPHPPGVEEHPYALLLGWTPQIGPRPSPWPVPHVWQWLPIQREYNTRRRQITVGCGRSARKGFYTEGMFPDEDEALKILESPEDMVFAKVEDIERVPVVITDANLPADMFRDVAMLQADWQAIAGVTSARLHNLARRTGTATEANQAEQATTQRELLMRAVVTRFMAQAGRKMSQLVKGTMTLDTMVKIAHLSEEETSKILQSMLPPQMAQVVGTNPQIRDALLQRFGKERWVTVTREALQFESRVTIVPGSARARTMDVERQQFLMFLQTLGQAPQLMMSRELLKYVAEAFDIYNDVLLDELTALAQKMIEVNARQAGRYQGGEGNGANTPAMNGGAPPEVASRLAAQLFQGRQ